MARVHKPEPGIEHAVELGVKAAYDGDTSPVPYSYGTPCYWAFYGARKAAVEVYAMYREDMGL